MPDESGSGPNENLENERATADRSNRLDPSGSVPDKARDRSDRKSLFIWVGIAFLPSAAFGYALRVVVGHPDGVLAVKSELPTKAIAAFFVFLATWVVSRIEKRRLDEYGIPPRQAFGWKFWEGSLWGFAMLSAIVLVLHLSGHFWVDSAALTGNAVLWWGLAWAVTFLAVSLSEEFAFRGYWLFFMSRRLRFWPAALFLSAVFGAAHLGNHGENIIGILQVVATGLLFCLMIRRTGNLWFAVGFHGAWDWAETFFYGTPDSGLLGVGRFLNSSVRGPNWITGGSAGPEGSSVALFVLLFCALLIHVRFPKAIYPDRPGLRSSRE